jgi:hypothetical protein
MIITKIIPAMPNQIRLSSIGSPGGTVGGGGVCCICSEFSEYPTKVCKNVIKAKKIFPDVTLIECKCK